VLVLTQTHLLYLTNFGFQDVTSSNFHEANPSFPYLRFPVAHWFKEDTETHEAVLEYFGRCHGWVQEALNGGSGVLIHCLAGAHRAGAFSSLTFCRGLWRHL
jgi:protein-tyrosine phosphatase